MGAAGKHVLCGVTAIAWLTMLLDCWLRGHSNMPIHLPHIKQHHSWQGSQLHRILSG